MARIPDPLEVLATQHAQIDDLFDLVATLRDPDALDELAVILTAHLGAEQELLYPSVSVHLTPEILDELAGEHVAIKRVLAELLWFGVSDPEFAARLEQLGTLIDGHIGYQEEYLFEHVAQTMPAVERNDLHNRITRTAAPLGYERARSLAS